MDVLLLVDEDAESEDDDDVRTPATGASEKGSFSLGVNNGEISVHTIR
jgi:hypothetical protein